MKNVGISLTLAQVGIEGEETNEKNRRDPHKLLLTHLTNTSSLHPPKTRTAKSL